MSEADTIVVGTALPRLSTVRSVDGHTVIVTWATGPRPGATEEVDLASVILTHKLYARLRGNPELLATVDLADDGHTLIWDGGRIDMAVVTIERLAREHVQTNP